MPKNIPVKVAKELATHLDCAQVIIAAWDGAQTHIVTYGKTIEDCAQAAAGGNKIKAALGWPKDLNAEPPRVKRLLERILQLERGIEEARDSILNGRGPLEAVLNNDQTTAVLETFDDALYRPMWRNKFCTS